MPAGAVEALLVVGELRVTGASSSGRRLEEWEEEEQEEPEQQQEEQQEEGERQERSWRDGGASSRVLVGTIPRRDGAATGFEETCEWARRRWPTGRAKGQKPVGATRLTLQARGRPSALASSVKLGGQRDAVGRSLRRRHCHHQLLPGVRGGHRPITGRAGHANNDCFSIALEPAQGKGRRRSAPTTGPKVPLLDRRRQRYLGRTRAKGRGAGRGRPTLTRGPKNGQRDRPSRRHGAGVFEMPPDSHQGMTQVDGTGCLQVHTRRPQYGLTGRPLTLGARRPSYGRTSFISL